MLWLKACERCENGDMYLDEDGFKHCLQCSHTQPHGESSVSRLEKLLGVVADDKMGVSRARPQRVAA